MKGSRSGDEGCSPSSLMEHHHTGPSWGHAPGPLEAQPWLPELHCPTDTGQPCTCPASGPQHWVLVQGAGNGAVALNAKPSSLSA